VLRWLLKKYLTPAFLSDVNTLSADALVAKYGTHVLLDISIGGVLRFNYNTVTTKESNSSTQTSDLKIGLGATVAKIVGINIGYTATQSQVTSIVNSSQNTQCTLQYYGGSTSGQSVTLVDGGSPSQTVDMGLWTASIQPTNASLIDIGHALYIYDFITNATKKAAVKQAVINHINAAQISIAMDPIYQYYNPNTGGDHYESGNPGITNFAGWQKVGTDFLAFLGYAPGTEPIYTFYNASAFDHFTTADVNATNGLANWQPLGIEFYAYKTQVAGTIPIYTYFNSSGGDHFTTANANIATQFPGWVKIGIAFYAYPNN
jgi:hypothetical protein